MNKLISCPGKVLLAGGYSILNPKNQGISVAIDSRFYSYSVNAEQLQIISPQFQETYNYGENTSNKYINGVFNILQRNPEYVSNKQITIMANNSYYQFDLTSKSIKKSGLGSSAGVIVSLLGQFINEKSILLDFCKQANFYAQEKVGSGFDIATAIYGTQLYSQEHILPLQFDQNYQILLIDMKQGTNTIQGVNKIQSFFNQNEEMKQYFEKLSQQTVEKLLALLYQPNLQQLRELNQEYRELLNWISEISGYDIEPDIATKTINEILQNKNIYWGVCPGAGGYDAMAFLGKDIDLNKIKQSLTSNFQLSLFNLDYEGIRIDNSQDMQNYTELLQKF